MSEQFPVTMRFKVSLGGAGGGGGGLEEGEKDNFGGHFRGGRAVEGGGGGGGGGGGAVKGKKKASIKGAIFEPRSVEVLSEGDWWKAMILKSEFRKAKCSFMISLYRVISKLINFESWNVMFVLSCDLCWWTAVTLKSGLNLDLY